jgi:urea transport system substrate-binding protein
MSFTRRFVTGAIGALALGAASLTSVAAWAEDTIKVGILHSLSGTMAISETTLKDVMLMLIDEQNKKPWSSTRPRTGRCSPKRPRS